MNCKFNRISVPDVMSCTETADLDLHARSIHMRMHVLMCELPERTPAFLGRSTSTVDELRNIILYKDRKLK